ncbi:hypothetical protein OHA21_23820 [Actinoplanes sp. NBC_00393]|uniref:hypothetical protein n=1 Tax=Actinoplanes sp. NBC_00393 TaxID=2975953 RepID=UPI002E1C281A
MRRVPLLVLLILLAGCGSDDKAGFGHLDMDDLRASSWSGQFTGPAQQMRARLTVEANGCVNVVVDGVERHPFWPDGTEVAEDPDDFERYLVDLPGDLRLATGDEFTASGIVAATPAPSTDPAGKAESLLGFCGVEAAPVAFPDAATFVT